MNKSFEYSIVTIKDLAVETDINPATGRKFIKHILVKGEPLKDSQRYWVSLFSRFGFNKAFFKYFDYSEVFERIAESGVSSNLRLCIERDSKGSGKLLGVSNPLRPIVPYDNLLELLNIENEGISYSNGIVESLHSPKNGVNDFEVKGDYFNNRFTMATPIDGYGAPNVYLSILRQVCSNGMVAMAPAFKSTITLGKNDDNIAFTILRVLEQFGNEEGFAALRNRIEAATNSWASVNESVSLYKKLLSLYNKTDDDGDHMIGTDGAALDSSVYIKKLLGNERDYSTSPIITSFHKMTGDTSNLYGLANIDALSTKRQRTLPVKCTVYDMINFATEVSTHHASPEAARSLNAWCGSLITSEYDMENTLSHYPDFADFHIDTKMANQMTGTAPNLN